MTVDRRSILNAGVLLTAAMAGSAGMAQAAPRRTERSHAPDRTASPALVASGADQTNELQRAIDRAAEAVTPLVLPAGTFRTSSLNLRDGTKITGSGAATVLEFSGGLSFITADGASRVTLCDFVVDGARLAQDAGTATGLITLRDCENIRLSGLIVRNGLINGLTLERCSGQVSDCSISDVSQTGLFSLDAKGLDIHHNRVTRCANNGIQVWRSEPGEDGSSITANRIEHIAAKAGGTGENGNGINVFRAGSVLVSDNRITDCAYSAIRANAASNIQMVSNSCARLGEVALYAEFGFEGALIAANSVDTAASGIVVTNFNEGGRLAVVQGNLVRNLFRREFEPIDKRGVGISIEADSLVTGNTVEGAPAAGIQIGWGPYLRDCSAAHNLIRGARVGILISGHPGGGQALIAQNMISGATHGAIRAMRDDGTPAGPDLAHEEGTSPNFRISGNLSS